MQLTITKKYPHFYSKAYSFEMGALSINNEIKKAVRQVKQHTGNKGCWVFDRGADNDILKIIIKLKFFDLTLINLLAQKQSKEKNVPNTFC